MTGTVLSADLLVVGAGMAGLTAAATARQRGASVILVERSAGIGGSAALSAGLIWTAEDTEQFLREDPDGDVERYRIVRDGLESGIEWIGELGLTPEQPVRRLSELRTGTHVDIGAFIDRCRSLVEGDGASWLFTETETLELLSEGDRVSGARVRNVATQEEAEIRARATVLATGGFQASRELTEHYEVPGALELVLRSNPYSDGAGLRLGLDQGAGTAGPMGSFYGHLMPFPWPEPQVSDYRVFAQKQSEFGVLIDSRGQRFVDESLGDQKNNLAVASRGPSLLVVDGKVLADHLSDFDRMAEARPRGAQFARASDLGELANATRAWGFPPDRLRATLQACNQFSAGTQDQLSVPRARNLEPLVTPPYSALMVQAAITFTYGGLLTDLNGRVLRGDGSLVDGLYAAGIDAGGLNSWGYTGGLSRALVFGRRVGSFAVARSGAPVGC